MFLPAQHEINQERDEGKRQHNLSHLSQFCEITSELPLFWTFTVWHVFRRFGFLRQNVFRCLFQGFGLLAEARDDAPRILSVYLGSS